MPRFTVKVRKTTHLTCEVEIEAADEEAAWEAAERAAQDGGEWVE